jgi:hypothetical protein
MWNKTRQYFVKSNIFHQWEIMFHVFSTILMDLHKILQSIVDFKNM